MPTFDYQCSKCSNIQEEFHNISEAPEIKCNKCGFESKKIFSPSTNFVLKGNDWPSQEMRIKKDMTNKNKKAAKKTKDKEKAGEAVTSINDLK